MIIEAALVRMRAAADLDPGLRRGEEYRVESYRVREPIHGKPDGNVNVIQEIPVSHGSLTILNA